MRFIVKIVLLNIFIILSFVTSFAQNISKYKDTIIDFRPYKIISYYQNGKVKIVGQFKRKTNNIYNVDKILPDSLYDFSVKNGNFIYYYKNGIVKKRKYYHYNKRTNRQVLGLKYGDWYGECWYAKYFFGKLTYSVQSQPRW